MANPIEFTCGTVVAHGTIALPLHGVSMNRRDQSQMGCWVAGLLGCWAVTASQALAQETDAEEGGLETIEHDDGTWSYVLSDDTREGELELRGAVTWEYQGQVHYSRAPEPIPAQWVELDDRWEDYSASGHIIGSPRYDAQGGEWLAVSVDEDALQALADEASRAAVDELGLTDVGGVVEDADLEWRSAETFWWEPESWTTVTCSGPSVTYHLHDGDDDRERQTSLTNRQKTAAVVDSNYGGGTHGYCSGVFLSSGSVLTSAHCVHDSGGTPLPAASVIVCSRGNGYAGADCSRALGMTVDPDWSGGFDPAHDLVVLDLPTLSGHGYMWLAAWSDSYVTSIDQHNIAFPSHSPPTTSCADNSATPIISGTDGFALSSQMEQIHTHILTSYWHTDFDGGKGHSGSPVFFCGDEWCDTGDNAWLVGIWSGWNGFYTTHAATKSTSHTTWILGAM